MDHDPPDDVVRSGTESDPSRTKELLPKAQTARLTREELHEWTATLIAAALVVILAGTYGATYWYAQAHGWEASREIALIILPSLTTLVGTVLGYYFAGRVN